MRIAVIGAGPVGRAVGGRWARAGHAVSYGVRSPERYDADPTIGTVAGALIRDTGARPVRIGGLDAADVLDGVTRLWFALTWGQGRGREHGLKVLDRP